MRKPLIALSCALMLTACGSSDIHTISKPADVNSAIKSAGYKCASWDKQSKQATCHLDGGGSITVHMDDDPVSALAWYFDEPDWVGGVHGDNWFIPCPVKQMSLCGDVASAGDVEYLPNPMYVK